MTLKSFSFFFFNLALLYACASCVTQREPVEMGIQPKYEALNPSRILAVPLFVVPDMTERVVVDRAALEAGAVYSVIETDILNAFTNQPSVNGVTFNVVRKELGAPPTLWDALNTELLEVTKKLTSRDPQDHTSFTRACINRHNILEFYVHCLSTSKIWRNNLNSLSAKILNADSALMGIVTEADKREEKNSYFTSLGLAVLLVDTNNGNLIWGRHKRQAIRTEGEKKQFPEWSEVSKALLTEDFWTGFPGRRIPKLEE